MSSANSNASSNSQGRYRGRRDWRDVLSERNGEDASSKPQPQGHQRGSQDEQTGSHRPSQSRQAPSSSHPPHQSAQQHEVTHPFKANHVETQHGQFGSRSDIPPRHDQPVNLSSIPSNQRNRGQSAHHHQPSRPPENQSSIPSKHKHGSQSSHHPQPTSQSSPPRRRVTFALDQDHDDNPPSPIPPQTLLNSRPGLPSWLSKALHYFRKLIKLLLVLIFGVLFIRLVVPIFKPLTVVVSFLSNGLTRFLTLMSFKHPESPPMIYESPRLPEILEYLYRQKVTLKHAAWALERIDDNAAQYNAEEIVNKVNEAIAIFNTVIPLLSNCHRDWSNSLILFYNTAWTLQSRVVNGFEEHKNRKWWQFKTPDEYSAALFNSEEMRKLLTQCNQTVTVAQSCFDTVKRSLDDTKTHIEVSKTRCESNASFAVFAKRDWADVTAALQVSEAVIRQGIKFVQLHNKFLTAQGDSVNGNLNELEDRLGRLKLAQGKDKEETRKRLEEWLLYKLSKLIENPTKAY